VSRRSSTPGRSDVEAWEQKTSFPTAADQVPQGKQEGQRQAVQAAGVKVLAKVPIIEVGGVDHGYSGKHRRYTFARVAWRDCALRLDSRILYSICGGHIPATVVQIGG